MQNPKISIIVPVYNVEKYLKECLNSIIFQAFTNFELLLIDDGSQDRSGKICDEFAAKDKRITVFHKENEGANLARKYGVERAKGEYINFVDSDDTIFPNSLELLYNRLTNEKLDIVLGVANFFLKDGYIKPNLHKVEGVFSSVEYLKLILQSSCSFSSCARLFKSSLFDKNTFNLEPEIKINEDKYTNICLGINANRIGLYNMVVYNYRYNPLSISKSTNVDCLAPFEKLFNHIRFIIKEANLYDELKDCISVNELSTIIVYCIKDKRILEENLYVQKVIEDTKLLKIPFQMRLLRLIILYPTLLQPIVNRLNKIRKYSIALNHKLFNKL